MANTPDEYLKQWFQYLDQLQLCARQVNPGDTPDDIVDFANKKQADVFLGSAPHQDQFKACVFAHTKIYVPDSAFSKTKTFFEFLEYIYAPLHGYVLGVFQNVAGEGYASVTPPDFDVEPTKDVYPSSGIQQVLIMALTTDMGEEWIPAAKVTPFLQLLSTDGKKIKDAVDFIVKPGVPKK